MIYPWQTTQWQQLIRLRREQRLAHAWLFTGMAGTGKAHFADELTKAFLCADKVRATEAGSLHPEKACHQCNLIKGRVHPNVQWISPEKSGQAIKVDQIRTMIEFINQSSLQGELRIAVINPANAMNMNAANALLKTLEEPPPHAIIILISDQCAGLPATIRSRCQRINFACPLESQALDWLTSKVSAPFDPALLLHLAHGAPLAALQLAHKDTLALRHELLQNYYLLSRREADPIKLAAKKNEVDVLQWLDCSLTWVMDLLRLQLGDKTSSIMNKDFEAQLLEVRKSSHIEKNVNFMQYLQQLRCQLCVGFNLNKQLMMENIFIRWMECIA